MQYAPSQTGSGGDEVTRDRPERQCIGCGRRGPQAEFLRLELDRDQTPPRVTVATGRKRSGRGAYLCMRRSCVDRALQRKAFQRAFRVTVVPDVEQMLGVFRMERATETEANDTAGG